MLIVQTDTKIPWYKCFRLGYKLMRKRKDGTYGPLFINAKQRLVPYETYIAEAIPTQGYAYRPGWHICDKPDAPHLSKKGRVWVVVAFQGYTEHQRPESQGGLWYTAKHMMILTELPFNDNIQAV